MSECLIIWQFWEEMVMIIVIIQVRKWIFEKDKKKKKRKKKIWQSFYFFTFYKMTAMTERDKKAKEWPKKTILWEGSNLLKTEQPKGLLRGSASTELRRKPRSAAIGPRSKDLFGGPIEVRSWSFGIIHWKKTGEQRGFLCCPWKQKHKTIRTLAKDDGLSPINEINNDSTISRCVSWLKRNKFPTPLCSSIILLQRSFDHFNCIVTILLKSSLWINKREWMVGDWETLSLSKEKVYFNWKTFRPNIWMNKDTWGSIRKEKLQCHCSVKRKSKSE